MPITVTCPGHAGPLQLPDGAAGKKVRCPKCNITFEVPAPTAPAPPPGTEASAPPPPPFVTSAAITEAPPAPKGPSKPPPVKRSKEEAAEVRRRLAQKDSASGYLGILTVLGVVFLISGCCVGVGVGGWFLFSRSPQPIAQEKPLPIDNNPIENPNPNDPPGGNPENKPIRLDVPPMPVVLEKGAFEWKTKMNPEEWDEQNFTRRKRFKFEAKAGIAYWVEAKDANSLAVRVEPPAGAATIRPRQGGSNTQVVFLAERAGEHIAVAAGHVNEVNHEFTMIIREVDETRPLPQFMKLTPSEPIVPPKIVVALETKGRSFIWGGAFAPDSKTYWTSHSDLTLTLWNQPYEIQGTYQLSRQLLALGVDSKGRLYAQPGSANKNNPDRKPTVENIEIYEGLKPKGPNNVMPGPTRVLPLRGIVKRFINSPDGRWMYFLDTHNRKLCRIDTEKLAIDREIDNISTSTTSFCLTPNGKKIYCCSETNRIDIIDATALKLERSLTIDKGQPKDIVATDAGMLIMVGARSFDGGGSGNNMVLDLTRKIEDRMNVIPLEYGIYNTHVVLMPDQRTVIFSGDRRLGVMPTPTRPALYPAGATEVHVRDYFTTGWFTISPDGRTILHDVGSILSVSR